MLLHLVCVQLNKGCLKFVSGQVPWVGGAYMDYRVAAVELEIDSIAWRSWCTCKSR